MFIIIILIGITGLLGTDLFVPSLPAIAKTFHQPMNHIELLITFFLVSFALSQLIYGPLSDRIGRKVPLIVGTSLFSIGALVAFIAPNFQLLCLARLVQGLGAGGGLPLARVVMRDSFSGVDLARHSSKMSIFISLTPAVAPLLGGIFQQYLGYQASFAFLLLYSVMLLSLILFYFKETHPKPNQQLTVNKILKNYGSLLYNSDFMRYVIISGIAFSSIILYANMVPFIIENQLHFSALVSGEIILAAAIGVSFGAFISSRLVHRVGSTIFVKAGIVIYLVVGILFVFSTLLMGTTLYTLVPLLFLITVACGFIFPNAATLSFSVIHCNIGIAGAIFGCLQVTTTTITNLILNMLSHQGELLLGVFYILLGILGVTMLMLKTTRREEAENSFVSRDFMPCSARAEIFD